MADVAARSRQADTRGLRLLCFPARAEECGGLARVKVEKTLTSSRQTAIVVVNDESLLPYDSASALATSGAAPH